MSSKNSYWDCKSHILVIDSLIVGIVASLQCFAYKIVPAANTYKASACSLSQGHLYVNKTIWISKPIFHPIILFIKI